MATVAYLGPVGGANAKLPFFSSRVAAGFPSPAQDHLEKKISIDELLDINAPQTYLVRAQGDSMIGVGIFDDDVLVVNRALDAQPGDIVIAAVNGEPVVKTLARDGQQIVLRSENPRFAPRYILEGDELMIWGVVVSSLRQHRRHG
jgi:DNA polymerase V